MTRRLVVVAACLFGMAGHGVVGDQASGPESARLTVVLSDLHQGEGRDGKGWLPTEDFRWAADFQAFLTAIDREGESAVDLVLNGDTFDLWQSATPDCLPRDGPAGCSEDEARGRLERVIRAHRDELAALGRLATQGSNRVIFVAGDHDAALALPGLSRHLTAAIAGPSDRVVVAGDHWRSRDGRLYAEHGHRIGAGAEPGAADGAVVVGPTSATSDRGRLRRSDAERALQPLWDRFEPKFPTVDNFAMATAGLRYALAAEDGASLGEHGRVLLSHFLFAVAWQQFRMDLDGGDTEPPTWDLARVRTEGPAWLASSLPNDDPLKKVVAADLAAGRLSGLVESYTDDQLTTICDYRAAVRRARRRLEAIQTQLSGRGPVVTECPRLADSRGAQFEYFWRSRDRIFGQHLERVERQLPRSPASIAVLVHGHTHLPDRSQAVNNAINGDFRIVQEGFSPTRGRFVPVVINSGAWQRTITPVQFERLRGERQTSDRELLATLEPEDLPPCYSFVMIPPYGAGEPVPAVRYWRRAADGQWGLATGCGA